MSIFGSIMSKIFHTAESVVTSGASPAAASTPATPATPAAATPAATPATQALQSVDIGAVLAQMAQQKGGGGNYQTSIVDLLKLLDLDSSLTARKALADELGVHAGADGSAEENIALHRAVVQKLEANGGKVPASMKA